MIKLINYIPIILRVGADENEFQSTGGKAKNFAEILQESHPGAWDGQQFTVPQDALLLVEAVVTVYAPELSSISISVNDVHVATDKRSCVALVPAKKGDLIKLMWEVSAPGETALGGQYNCHLNICELAG